MLELEDASFQRFLRTMRIFAFALIMGVAVFLGIALFLVDVSNKATVWHRWGRNHCHP